MHYYHDSELDGFLICMHIEMIYIKFCISICFQPYDTARTECKTNEYSNVLDMVEITNPIARNMLIDLCKLESILLVPTDNQCFALLEEARNVPRNCFRAHTLKGDIYMPAPNFASYGATQKTAKILQTSRDDLIR